MYTLSLFPLPCFRGCISDASAKQSINLLVTFRGFFSPCSFERPARQCWHRCQSSVGRPRDCQYQNHAGPRHCIPGKTLTEEDSDFKWCTVCSDCPDGAAVVWKPSGLRSRGESGLLLASVFLQGVLWPHRCRASAVSCFRFCLLD